MKLVTEWEDIALEIESALVQTSPEDAAQALVEILNGKFGEAAAEEAGKMLLDVYHVNPEALRTVEVIELDDAGEPLPDPDVNGKFKTTPQHKLGQDLYDQSLNYLAAKFDMFYVMS